MKCPSIDRWLSYTQNLLPEADKALMFTHLQEGCGNCKENLQWLDEVGRVARQDRSFLLPEETVKGMVAWFRSQPAPAGGKLRQLVASLLFDSVLPLREAAVRNDSAASVQAASRQMLFQTEGYDIDLRFESLETSQQEDLLGQIVSQAEPIPATETVTVRLLQEEGESAMVEADASGFFRFAGISSGVYDLKIEMADVEILLSEIPTARKK